MSIAESRGFDRITLPSLVDECHRRIKEQIIAGELGPGAAAGMTRPVTR
ncbi:hypothetical protein QRX50_38195 [Amycolatopsis carbonis]|uniref:Uncharacterized protein n=1 Tax=Amycolatopsis carbonis TaxID=715471 RepID=A0A9Y2MVX4_9PSEU|nr:hypothetical protein [Amycolatopsis sp. 2-15]WIX77187.1 hypothetical protein QRX50_38195 [Amycolatopsis sp. 2-15]